MGSLGFTPRGWALPGLQAEPVRRLVRPFFDYRLRVPFDRRLARPRFLPPWRHDGGARRRAAPESTSSRGAGAGCTLEPTALSPVVAYRSCPMDQEFVSTSRAQRRWGKGVALAISSPAEMATPHLFGGLGRRQPAQTAGALVAGPMGVPSRRTAQKSGSKSARAALRAKSLLQPKCPAGTFRAAAVAWGGEAVRGGSQRAEGT